MFPTPSIAVLPFVNMSDAPEQEYVSDGLTEEIIHALTEHTQMRVIARTSSFAFKGHNLDIREIGAQLHVGHVLEGSVRRDGQQVRVTAQLIRVADGSHDWSAVFERTWETIFALQDEIALEIADRVREQFGHFDLPNSLPLPTAHSANAYQLYLQGLYAYQQQTPTGYQQAITHFEAAVAADPQMVLAWARLADVHCALGLFRLSPQQSAFERAWACAQQAVAANPEEPLAHVSMARARFCLDWHIQQAAPHLITARMLSPHHPEVVALYATYLSAGSRFAKGHEELIQALQLDPCSINLRSELAQLFLIQEKYEKCLTQVRMLLQQQPQFIAARYLEGRCYFMQGRYEDALSIFTRLPTWQGDAEDLAWMACCHWQMGQEAQAESLIQKAPEGLFLHDPSLFHYPRILYRVLQGSLDAAIVQLKTAIEARAYPLLSFVADPAWRALRDQASFQELVTQYHRDFTFPALLSPRKYQGSKLNPELAEDIFQRVDRYMESNQPYLDPDLSLRSLAQQLDVLPNYLSQVLNDRYQQNFYTFINQYRVNAFKARLQQADAAQFTLLAHAYECGFNSKTTFNAAFKRLTGLTPSQYVKQQR